MTWEQATLKKSLDKYLVTAKTAKDIKGVPYIGGGKGWKAAENNPDGWWTNGFWPGIMWLGHAIDGDGFWLSEARRAQDIILPQMHGYYNTSHDLGFMYLLSVGADYKLTGSMDALRETLLAANLLQGRWNPAGFIRSWNGEGREGWVIVDCMMNLPLLYSATKLTGDPRYAMLADLHADFTAREHIRENGSSNHIVIFDPYTARKLFTPAGQGKFDGSSWSRGQAWALYGFTLAAMHGRSSKYLYTAERVAKYFISQIDDNGLTRVDFDQPKDEQYYDNIAGAVAACGLIELNKLTGKQEYLDAALKLLHGIDDHTANYGHGTMGILTRCTAAYDASYGKEKECNLIYGDFFYLEALAKLAGVDPMLWVVDKKKA